VVHDEDVCPEHLLAGLVVETRLVGRTLPAEAVAAFALHQIPDALERLERQVGLAAVAGLARPPADLHQLIDGAGRFQ
jgi:hypothetical protein